MEKDEIRYSTDGKMLVKAPKDIEECIIREGTEVIASNAFWWCEKLTSVTIPSSVTSIQVTILN